MNYETEDFALATTLHALGAKYTGFEKRLGNKLAFRFESTEDLERIVPAYYRDEVCISPQKFLYSQKFLKSIIHST